MLRRILRTRTGRDIADTAVVLAVTALILFGAGTLAAEWLVHLWTMAVQAGATIAAVFLFVAVPVSAGLGMSRLVRVLRAVRGGR